MKQIRHKRGRSLPVVSDSLLPVPAERSRALAALGRAIRQRKSALPADDERLRVALLRLRQQLNARGIKDRNILAAVRGIGRLTLAGMGPVRSGTSVSRWGEE